MSRKTQDFNFELPSDLIAQKPVFPRDQSRLLVYNQSNLIDSIVANLSDYLDRGDIVVFNDSKVIKAKLEGVNSVGAQISVNLNCQLPEKGVWQVFAKPAKKLKIGDQFKIADDFYAVVTKKEEDGPVNLKFNVTGEDFFRKLKRYGKIPLPPYIKRSGIDCESDETSYQTIYAKEEGAVAAPTAGLHFTNQLFERLEKKGIQKAFVTLQVGGGTFLPVKADYIQEHKMHEEYFTISESACSLINETKRRGGKIAAIGTTSLRVLESIGDSDGYLRPHTGKTKIFIYPPYNFKVVDILLTNFHLPKTTLFMLVCAFLGTREAFRLYEHAIQNRYRFYSYGDACLLFKQSK